MEPNTEEERIKLDASQSAEESDADTVLANKAMDDAFYGNGEPHIRDIADVAEVNRNQS